MEQGFSRGCYQAYFDGRMTSDAIENLRAHWTEKLETHEDMVIDLSGVECIDLAGLHLMLQIQKKAEMHGKHVDFIGFNPAIQDVLYVFHWLADLEWEKRSRSRLANGEGAP